jgi:hypothetical protein
VFDFNNPDFLIADINKIKAKSTLRVIIRDGF